MGAMSTDAPRIPAQFNGPNTSGNGGYVSGLVASHLGRLIGVETPVVTTMLRLPPPLDKELAWDDGPDSAALLDKDATIAVATVGDFAGHAPVAAVTRSEAEEARRAYEGYDDHPFPRCFTCGSARHAGDGLQVYSGPVGDGRMACTWSAHPAFAGPDGLLDGIVMWAALDCPGGWAAGIKATPMVLGRMTAELVRRPAIGEPCVVVGALREVERRKNFTATTIYGSDGDVVGRAEQTWITIDIGAFS